MQLDETHDAALSSWVAAANDPATDFPLQNLPFGRFRRAGEAAFQIGVAIGDQVLDLAAEGRWGKAFARAGKTKRGVEAIHLGKTGALIAASLVVGGCLGGGSARQLAALEDIGLDLGLAFQITDDLLDATGRADDAGKRVGKDAARNKLTYPGLLGVEESRARAAGLIDEARRLIAPLNAPRLDELLTFVLTRDR